MRAPRLGDALGRLSLRCAARPRQVVAWILVLTAVMGLGMMRLSSDTDMLRILPRDDPHTWAAQNASVEFRGFYDFVTLFYEIDPQKCAAANERLPYRLSAVQCGNVTDEVYVRGMEELGQFMMQELPALEHRIDLPSIIKTVNWTNSGYGGMLEPVIGGRPDEVGRPRDEAFAMPGTDPAGEAMYEGAWRGANAVDESITDVVAPTFQAGRTLFFFNSTGWDNVELGRLFYAAVAAYDEAAAGCDAGRQCVLEWNVFRPGVFPVRGTTTLEAHASDTAGADVARLAPIIAVAILLVLFLAFRDARVLLVATANLAVAFVWTAGLMGWLGIPFSALNMTVVPLILGVGIDYGIHMVSEFFEHRSDGDSHEEAFGKAGGRAGLAMFIATVTTALGLLVMVLSPSILMAQLAIVSSIALVVTFLFTMTFIPAVLTLTARAEGRRQRGSSVVLAMARGVHRARWPVAVLLVGLSVGAIFSVRALEPEPFGNPELNYPPGDRVRDDAETINRLFFGGQTDTQTNYLIVEGDLTQPAAHRFLDALEAELRAHTDLQGFNTATLTRVVRAWVAIDDGTPDAAADQLTRRLAGFDDRFEDMQYPQTQDEIRATFDAIFASPFANFMTILLDEDYELGMVAYDTRQELTYAEVQKVWGASLEAVAEAQRAVYGTTQDDAGYVGPRVHLFGNNAFSYLFIEREQPWVNAVGILSFALVTVMIAALTRNWRATTCVATVMGVTGLWWLGILPHLGVGLSVGLMLPIVFIMAIGSDDAVHLVWNMERTRRPETVYRHVGKAVLLTSLTTGLAFALFSDQTDLLVRRTLLATAAAVLVMWVATMLIVPLFYPPGRRAPESAVPAVAGRVQPRPPQA